jgi:hypothetical protein
MNLALFEPMITLKERACPAQKKTAHGDPHENGSTVAGKQRFTFQSAAHLRLIHGVGLFRLFPSRRNEQAWLRHPARDDVHIYMKSIGRSALCR